MTARGLKHLLDLPLLPHNTETTHPKQFIFTRQGSVSWRWMHFRHITTSICAVSGWPEEKWTHRDFFAKYISITNTMGFRWIQYKALAQFLMGCLKILRYSATS